MKRLYVFCEGPTEESFVSNLLGPHFEANSITPKPLLLPNKARSTSRQHKGGWTDYSKARRFIRQAMEEQHADDTWFTTMLDLYSLPDDFPQPNMTANQTAATRVVALEEAFRQDICTDKLWRFTPNLQLHEFEALILAEPEALLHFYPDSASAIAALKSEISGLEPEQINDGHDTAPSKRILRHFPEYAKVLAGTITTMHIGLPKLRARCPHFNEWMSGLECRLA